ncbi:MAG: hypothetical protein V4622_03460 [Bacteroidota bacterium]
MEAKTESNYVKVSEFNRFGLISVIILIIGCMGGITVGMGAINNTFTLTLVIVPTMLSLSLLLGVAPMKWVINSAIIATVIDVILITYFLLTEFNFQ